MTQQRERPSGGIDRRGFLAGAVSAAAIGSMPARAAGAQNATRPKKRAKNLIFAVADGCGPGAVQLGELFVRMRDDRSLNWTGLLNRSDATTSLIDTRSADGHVTDSAAAASAWSIGELVNNRAISWTPDDRTPRPLFLRAQDTGKSIGMVATTYIWDATPVAWVANAPGRKRWRALAEQLVEARPRVALGGGADAFPRETIGLDPKLTVARSRQQMLDASPSDPRLLGLFAPETFPYQTEYDARIPTLSEMTQTALERLRNDSPEGFCLVVEAAKVDHAAHANDGASLVKELAHFDETLGGLIDFADEDGETLLVVTSDHSNANPGITYYAQHGVSAFENILKSKQSFNWILDTHAERAGDTVDPAILFQLLEEASGLSLTKGDLAMLEQHADETPTDGFALNRKIHVLMGAILANHTGLAFLSPNHTSDPVTLTSIGPGRELFTPCMRINEINAPLVSALGLPDAS